MDTVYKLILVLHFVGVAMVLGGFFAQMGKKPPVVTHWVRDGAFTRNGAPTGYALGMNVGFVNGRRRLSHSGEVSGFTAGNAHLAILQPTGPLGLTHGASR